MKLAVVGTGRMGGAMAGTLRRAGAEVTVFNRGRARAEAVAKLTGAAVAASAREAAAGAGVVISSLADDAAVLAVYDGPDGLAAGLGPGAVVLETSTIHPRTVAELRPLVEAQGGALVDAPVSGSVPLVERGELMVMAGGDPAALERARPALDALAARVLHLGPLGTGAAMKLAVNSVVHALNVALSEALVLAEKAGIPRASAYEAFASSAVAAPFVHYKRAAYERPGTTPVAFSLALVAKDLDLALDLAAEAGAPMDQARTNRRLVGEALAAGLGEDDMSAVASFLRDAAGRH